MNAGIIWIGLDSIYSVHIFLISTHRSYLLVWRRDVVSKVITHRINWLVDETIPPRQENHMISSPQKYRTLRAPQTFFWNFARKKNRTVQLNRFHVNSYQVFMHPITTLRQFIPTKSLINCSFEPLFVRWRIYVDCERGGERWRSPTIQ